MRHSLSSLAFLKIGPDRYLWAEGDENGFEISSHPTPDSFSLWAPDFFLEDDESFLKPDTVEILTRQEVLARMESPTAPSFLEFLRHEVRWKEPDRELFERGFSALQTQIQSGNLQKGVPLIWSEGRLPSPDSLWKFTPQILKALVDLPEPLIPFLLIHGGEWMFGATPETLVRRQGKHLFTQAVAGTTFDKNKILLDDPKERHEHQLVIQFLQEALKDEGEVVIHETKEKELPRLKHLITEIRVDLRRPSSLPDVSFVDVARKLHPTPALGGSPTDKAFRWLKDQPPGSLRRRYGAPFGYVDQNGDGLLIVAIRCLQSVEDRIFSMAGAGVVSESILENEWMEMNSKRESVFKIFEGQSR